MTDGAPIAAALVHAYLALKALRDAAAAARLNPEGNDGEWLAHMDAADAEIAGLRAILAGEAGSGAEPAPETTPAPVPEPHSDVIPVFGCGGPDSGVVVSGAAAVAAAE